MYFYETNKKIRQKHIELSLFFLKKNTLNQEIYSAFFTDKFYN